MNDAKTFPFRKLRAMEYIPLPNFITAEGGIKLSSSEQIVFSLIYSFAPDPDTSEFFGSSEYICTRTCLSRRSVLSALKSLQEQNLIVCTGEKSVKNQPGKAIKKYACNSSKIDRIIDEFNAFWDSVDTASEDEFSEIEAVSQNSETTICSGGKPELLNVQNLHIRHDSSTNSHSINVQNLRPYNKDFRVLKNQPTNTSTIAKPNTAPPCKSDTLDVEQPQNPDVVHTPNTSHRSVGFENEKTYSPTPQVAALSKKTDCRFP